MVAHLSKIIAICQKSWIRLKTILVRRVEWLLKQDINFHISYTQLKNISSFSCKSESCWITLAMINISMQICWHWPNDALDWNRWVADLRCIPHWARRCVLMFSCSLCALWNHDFLCNAAVYSWYCDTLTPDARSFVKFLFCTLGLGRTTKWPC